MRSKRAKTIYKRRVPRTGPEPPHSTGSTCVVPLNARDASLERTTTPSDLRVPGCEIMSCVDGHIINISPQCIEIVTTRRFTNPIYTCTQNVGHVGRITQRFGTLLFIVTVSCSQHRPCVLLHPGCMD